MILTTYRYLSRANADYMGQHFTPAQGLPVRVSSVSDQCQISLHNVYFAPIIVTACAPVDPAYIFIRLARQKCRLDLFYIIR